MSTNSILGVLEKAASEVLSAPRIAEAPCSCSSGVVGPHHPRCRRCLIMSFWGRVKRIHGRELPVPVPRLIDGGALVRSVRLAAESTLVNNISPRRSATSSQKSSAPISVRLD